jgi:predicted O-methyltransferase YrrM
MNSVNYSADDYDVYVDDLYDVFLARKPLAGERAHWVGVLRGGMTWREAFNRFKASPEYLERTRIAPAHRPGHYYSPIVDPVEARKYANADRNADPDAILEVRICMSRMMQYWEAMSPHIRSSQFPARRQIDRRYFTDNDIYSVGDAAILRAMILLAKPRNIIEIGSGFSSACMLDTLDEGRLDTRIVFIEPHTERLRALLRAADDGRCSVIEAPVQTVDPSQFSILEENDILFIDSTHVMKAGSDVNYELFELLPRLNRGVMIHFHDVQYPFEYPDQWIFERMYSWNEIYGLRAFLMHNDAYQICYFNSLFARKHRNLVAETYDKILLNPGGGLWLKKVVGPSRVIADETRPSPVQATRCNGASHAV